MFTNNAYISKRYKTGRQILYNQLNTETLHQAFIPIANIALIGGDRKIFSGSFLAGGQRLVGRARTLSPYKGDGKLFVNNPYPFAKGDILRVIGSAQADPFAEYQAVASGSAPTLGTITRVVGDLVKQLTRVTFTGLVKGNIASIWIEGIPLSIVAETSSVKSTMEKLAESTLERRGALSILNDLELTPTETGMDISVREAGEIFTAYAGVEKGGGETAGTATVEVVAGIGCLEFTPAAGAPAQVPAGSKVGRINDVPLGVINWDYSISDCDFNNSGYFDLSAYNKAMIYRRGLPYLDGHLIQAIPGLAYMPGYGERDEFDFFLTSSNPPQ